SAASSARPPPSRSSISRHRRRPPAAAALDLRAAPGHKSPPLIQRTACRLHREKEAALRPRFLLLLTALACPASHLLAQTSPFGPEALYRDLANEISGDRAYEYDRRLTPYHRTAGSRDFFAAAEVIRQAAAAAGLEDVKLIRQKWDGHAWSC